MDAQTLSSHIIWQNLELWAPKHKWPIVTFKNPDFREVNDRAFGYYPVITLPRRTTEGEEKKEGWGTSTAFVAYICPVPNKVESQSLSFLQL